MNKTYFTSKDARLLIKNYGFAIFPAQGIYEGQCTCGDINCTNQGKHPATKNGLTDATKDIDQLLKLWAARKHLNVAIATGAESGIFVIDIDGAEGEESLKSLGPLPNTLTARTARGRHLFYAHPGIPVITKRGILEKIDVRGDGGYVIGAGSNHLSGAKYEWVNPLEIIAPAPDCILSLVIKDRIKPKALNIVNPRQGLIFKDRASINDVQEMLNYVDPDLGYDEWINIGMALQADGYPFSVWDNWSRGGSKYDGHNMGSHWKSFKPGGGVTMGTLIHMAKKGGWLPKQNSTNIIHPIPYTADREETGREVVDADGQVFTLDPDMFYIKAGDIHESLDTSDFIQGLLTDGALSVVYGESNCGKTFFMSDVAMHVAMGKRWRDKRVEAGGVIYVALEGSYGLKNRVAAFKKHYAETPVNFAMVPCPVDFMDPEGNINKFINMLRIAKADLGSVRLVVIDTLARALTGGDENSGQDMGMLVHHADRIRYETGAHVCFVHHSGKDKARGARGHSSLRAAVDTEIEISRDPDADYSQVKIVKQREMEIEKEVYFSLKRIELGLNKYKEEITSCVVMTYDSADVKPSKSSAKLNPIQKFLFDCLIEAIIRGGKQRDVVKDMPPVKCVHYDDLRLVMEEKGFREMMATEKKTSAEQVKSATQSARLALKHMGKINFENRYIWLAENEEEK